MSAGTAADADGATEAAPSAISASDSNDASGAGPDAGSIPCTADGGMDAPDLVRNQSSDSQGPSVVLHWPAQTQCIAVFIDPSLAASASEIRQALAAWSLPCSRLCFADPVVAATSTSTLTPPLDGSLRFTATAAGVFSDSNASVFETSTVELDTGSLLGAVVSVEPTATLGDLARGVGDALGIENPSYKVTHASTIGPDNLPLADAVATFCALYGANPLCP